MKPTERRGKYSKAIFKSQRDLVFSQRIVQGPVEWAMTRVPIRTIIETWKAFDQNISEAARQLGIDRRTVKRWVNRGRQPRGYVRWQGVERQSTAPKHPKRVLWGEAGARVRRLREATGFCREKLAVLAQGQGLEVSASSVSTAGGLDSAQHQATATPFSEWPSHAAP